MSVQRKVRDAIEGLKHRYELIGPQLTDEVEAIIGRTIRQALREHRSSGATEQSLRNLRNELRAELLRTWQNVYSTTHQDAYMALVNSLDRGYLGGFVGLPPSVNVPFQSLLDAGVTMYRPPTPDEVRNVLRTATLGGHTAEYYINKAIMEAGNLDAALRLDLAQEGVEVFVRRIAEGKGPASIARDLRDLPQTQAYFRRYPGRLSATARTWTAKFHEDAKHDTMESFRDITGGAEEYSATLDGRTRPEHMALDGNVYSENPRSGQFSLLAKPPMPNGILCRCTFIPYLEPLDTVIRSASLRASIDGPVQGDTIYAQWFSTQGRDRKEEIVGSGRYTLAQKRYGRVELAEIMHRSGTRFKTTGELQNGL